MKRAPVALLLAAALPAILVAQSHPTSVSPGEIGRFAIAAERCPTFSWSAVSNATSYEILLFEVDAEMATIDQFPGGQPETPVPPKLRASLPGTATSWTPNADSCPEPGRFAWLVGAKGDTGTSWSSPRLFEIPKGTDSEMEAAIERVLERLLAEGRLLELQTLIVGETGSAPVSSEPSSPSPSAPASAIGPAAIRGQLAAASGEVYGVHGVTGSPDTRAAGVVGEATAPSGDTAGVRAINQSPDGAAGVFENPAGGPLLKGVSSSGEVLSADATGAIVANAFILDCASASTFYRDGDEDSFGDPARNAQACIAPSGYVVDSTDCDDTDPAINPGAAEAEGTNACIDGLDNDCDTLIDLLDGDCCGGALVTYYRDADADLYGDPLVSTATCGGNPPPGYVTNDLDCDDSDSGINPDAAEACNGLDDNCDGATDEGNPGGGVTCDSGQSGVCQAGTTLCSGGALSCEPDNSPTSEVCDGLDNDCDGTPDEGNPGGGGSCTTGLPGICTTGTLECLAGALTCTQDSQPTAELCNGLDDDCDGNEDEGNPGGGITCDTGQSGICQAGTTLCSAGSISCEPDSSPTTEICNGLDDDCDGSADEGNPGGGGSCSTGLLGICDTGTLNCSSGALDCVQDNPATTEICNGLDDDCDGTEDEGNPGGGGSCDGADADLCDEGILNCVTGSLTCSDNTGDNLELCDGSDNDCNPATFDGADEPTLGNACDGADADLCEEGTLSCSAGSLSCSDTTGDSQEACNNLDDDCDGVVDSYTVPQDEFIVNCDTDGVCAQGSATCVAGSYDCDYSGVAEYETVETLCDGLDNDCDGDVDEGC